MNKRFNSVIRIITLIMCILLLVTACAPTSENTDTGAADTTGTEPVAESTSEETTTDAPEKDEWELLREKATTGKGIKVLFIGNSLTYYNDMPDLFMDLATLAGKRVTVDSLTFAGKHIVNMKEDNDMWSEIDDKITSTSWDLVIFQTDRNETVMTEYFPDYPAKSYAAAEELATMIKDTGAIPMIYSTFGVNKGYLERGGYTKTMTSVEHTNLVIAFDAAVSQRLDCKVVYAGATFNNVIASNPEINLYHTDDRHPSLAGSVLVACDFYTVIFGESPENVAYKGGLDMTTATVLRKAAAGLLTYTPRSFADID